MSSSARSGHYHTVVPGDCLTSLAHRYGMGSAETLHELEENRELREARPDPNLLLPGDRVFVPAPASNHRCDPGSTHRFTARRPRCWLRVEIHRRHAEPLAGLRYVLQAAGETFEGQTGDDGLVEEEVDARACHAVLKLFADGADTPTRILPLRVGHLDPHHTDTGARSRLRNLGYGTEEEDLRTFQREAELDETGQLDEATRSKLRELHKI